MPRVVVVLGCCGSLGSPARYPLPVSFRALLAPAAVVCVCSPCASVLHAHILRYSARSSWTVTGCIGAGRMHQGLCGTRKVPHDLHGVMAWP